MPIRTTANTYSRGVPKGQQNGFFFAAQSNNTVCVPMHKFLANHNFYNRTMSVSPRKTFPWNNI